MGEEIAVELYRRYRPTRFKDVLGQPEAVKQLAGMLRENKLPHCLLFSGPSGTGKTTLARILKGKLNCCDRDFIEVNAAESRGIDMVRDLGQSMPLAPWQQGGCRIFLIDEAHKLTSDAQGAFLKKLEDTPQHVYFFLATTDPHKLLPTIRTRATEVVLKLLDDESMSFLLESVIEKEIVNTPEDGRDWGKVIQRLVEVCSGSARKALVILHQVMQLPTTGEQLEAIQKQDTARQAIDIARCLMDTKATWPQIAKLLQQVEAEPEDVRRLVLAYAAKVLLGGSNVSRAYNVLEVFRAPFYDSGKPGLVWACAEVFRSK